MENIIPALYVGDDRDYERLKDKLGWSFVRACKEGAGGHRETLGYTTAAAPKDKNYLSVEKGDRVALNFIDPNDPHFIPVAMVETALRFMDERISQAKKVLIACNQGHSRGPILAMLYLRGIGDLRGNFHTSENIFRTLYPAYDPSLGTRQFAKTHWNKFENILRKETHGQ